MDPWFPCTIIGSAGGTSIGKTGKQYSDTGLVSRAASRARGDHVRCSAKAESPPSDPRTQEYIVGTRTSRGGSAFSLRNEYRVRYVIAHKVTSYCPVQPDSLTPGLKSSGGGFCELSNSISHPCSASGALGIASGWFVQIGGIFQLTALLAKTGVSEICEAVSQGYIR